MARLVLPYPVALLLMLTAATPGHGTDLTCPDPRLHITAAADPALARRTCDIAAAALANLDSCGVRLDSGVAIALKDQLPDGCMGLYHCGEDRIELLSPEALSEQRHGDSIFAILTDAEYFASVLTHELAHAAYDAVPCPFASCIATSEYVAYAMQIRALPPGLRDRVAWSDPGATPIRSAELTPMIALFAPDIFGKKAWLHFSQRPAPCDYMGLIMDGAIFFDRERP